MKVVVQLCKFFLINHFLHFNICLSLNIEKIKGPIFESDFCEAMQLKNEICTLQGMQQFIANGGNPNLYIKHHELPILLALIADHYPCPPVSNEVIEFLIKSGANINAESKHEYYEGKTFLHFLISRLGGKNLIEKDKAIELIQIFKKYNANFNLKDTHGKTPLDSLFNRCYWQWEIAIELIKCGVDVCHDPQEFAYNEYLSVYKWYLNAEYFDKTKFNLQLLNFMHYNKLLPNKINESLSEILSQELISIVREYAKGDMDVNHKHFKEERKENRQSQCCIIN